MFIERRGDYLARIEEIVNGWWKIHVSKNGEPICVKSCQPSKVQSNPYMCITEAFDEAKEIESEVL